MGGVSSEHDANFGASRVACQNTLRAPFASVKWFAWEGNPVLLTVLWERDTVQIGPNMECLPKVPVCVCVYVCVYIRVSYLPLSLQVSHGWHEADEKPQCPSWRSTAKGCPTGEWDAYGVWIGNEFPGFHVFDITLFGFNWCSLYSSFQPLPKGKSNASFHFVPLTRLIRDASSRS